MSDLDDALYKRMTEIVLNESRPFSYADFHDFEVDGRAYNLTHGTYRNKISTFSKQGKTERDYCSGYANHTLKGRRFGKLMTHNRRGAFVPENQIPFMRFLITFRWAKTRYTTSDSVSKFHRCGLFFLGTLSSGLTQEIRIFVCQA